MTTQIQRIEAAPQPTRTLSLRTLVSDALDTWLSVADALYLGGLRPLLLDEVDAVEPTAGARNGIRRQQATAIDSRAERAA